jgi:hypothetical protein
MTKTTTVGASNFTCKKNVNIGKIIVASGSRFVYMQISSKLYSKMAAPL